ncbi:MAG: hypothetical protein ACKVU4_00120 [Phycisphaerales bacterium]
MSIVRCPDCGYLLHGLPASDIPTCPECGKRIDAAALAHEARIARYRKYDWLGFALSPLMALLPAALVCGTLLPRAWFPPVAIGLSLGLATWCARSALERRAAFRPAPSPEQQSWLGVAIVLAFLYTGLFTTLIASGWFSLNID